MSMCFLCVACQWFSRLFANVVQLLLSFRCHSARFKDIPQGSPELPFLRCCARGMCTQQRPSKEPEAWYHSVSHPWPAGDLKISSLILSGPNVSVWSSIRRRGPMHMWCLDNIERESCEWVATTFAGLSRLMLPR